jgi:Polyketide cyclase / dehydrase and lipid transport
MMDLDVSPYQHTETVTIAASPEVVYDLVADVTRMGEWSPVCTGGEWDDDTRAWFTGSNSANDRTWQTRCRVDVAERGREFTFVNYGMAGDIALVRWRYTFAPVAGGTEVAESWEVLDNYPGFLTKMAPSLDPAEYLDGVVAPTKQGMAETLTRLKATAEA